MAKWERWPPELEIQHPYPFDMICGYCLTKEEVDFHRNTGGLVMAYEKEMKGAVKYDSESKKYQKFVFEAEEGAVGYICFPKTITKIPSRIVLDNEMRDGIEKKIVESIQRRNEYSRENT